MTAAARTIALEIRGRSASESDFVQNVFQFVNDRVRFVREPGEVFARADYTLAAGAGDCDDHARVVYALLRAGGIPARLAFLYRKGDRGPRHVVAQALLKDRGWTWLETTVPAAFGEHPYEAAKRLGLVSKRQDIASEVRTMTEKDLAPLPPDFDRRTPPDQLARDAHALEVLGMLDPRDACALTGPSDPRFRRAVLEVQKRAPITRDGLIGPQTRKVIAHMLPADDFAMGYLAALTRVSSALSSHISPSFLAAVKSMAARMRARGARITGEDLLAVWLVESGIKNIPNRDEQRAGVVEGHGGLNQMGLQERRGAGFDGSYAQWLALPLEEQLPFVERFYVNATGGNMSVMRDAGSLYLVNFLPARASHAGDPSFVLATKSEDDDGSIEYMKAHRGDWYAWNKALDRDHKGTIVVADMTKVVEAGKRNGGPYWAEVLARYNEDGPDPSGIIASNVIAVVLVGALAAAAWWYA